MFKQNNTWFGALIGLVIPGIAFFFTEVLKKNIPVLKGADLLYIGCIALNLLLLRYYFSIDKEKTSKGIMASTFICAFIFFYYKTHQ